MPTITYDRFDGGLDRRKTRHTQDANRLWVCENAYINNGGKLVKRPGLRKFAELTAGTVGLRSLGGKLITVSGGGSVTHASPELRNYYVRERNGVVAAKSLHFAASLNGTPYVAVEYTNGETWHSFLEGTEATQPRTVLDDNCPHSKSVSVAANSVFATDDDVVRFSATNAPKNWTTANDAGFLATGGNSAGATVATALAEFQGDLAVFFEDGGQVWTIDPDPAAISLRQRLGDVGTLWPRSHAAISGDVIFLSPWGFRSIGVSSAVDNIREGDVGLPIDDLVAGRYTDESRVMAERFSGGGQYWCVIDREVWVYSYSRLAKIAAWSRYVLPFDVDDICSHRGRLYLRSLDTVYVVDPTYYLDDGVPYRVLVETPFLDAKSPGSLKQWMGMDISQTGECDVSYLYDARDETLATVPQRVSGVSHPAGTLPVELCSTSLALRFELTNDQPWQLDGFTLYYENLGLIA